MKKFSFLVAAAGLLFCSSLVVADSNATGGLLASSSVNLGAGPFGHGAAVGSIDNTKVNVNFSGGFQATHVRFSGTLTSLISGTWGSEADIRITQLDSLGFSTGQFFNWQNPNPSSTFTTSSYNSTQALTGGLINVDPVNGGNQWQIEFYESFSDGAGPDSNSSNVTVTFERRATVTDSNGIFSAGVIAGNSIYNSVGEFAVSQTAGANGNNDRYSFTLLTPGTLFAETTASAGFTGNINGDTEIGIFDASGNIVASNINGWDDDGGSALYSFINGIQLAAGNYTLVIGDFDTNFSATSTLSNLTFGSAPAAGYDYGLVLTFIPEPTSAAMLGLGALGMFVRRRRA